MNQKSTPLGTHFVSTGWEKIEAAFVCVSKTTLEEKIQ